MEKETNIIKKTKLYKKLGKDQFIIFILLGILLIIIAIPTKENNNKNVSESSIWDTKTDKIDTESLSNENLYESEQNEDEINAYEKHLENKLEQAIAVMEGAGKTKVMVTTHSSKEKVVEKDRPEIKSDIVENDSEGGNRNTNEIDYKEETVYMKESDGSSSPYVVKTLQPEIEGVVVIAQGGGRQEVKKNITEAIVALFDIEPHKIKVVKMKSE